MKYSYADGSYVDFSLTADGKVLIVLGARNPANPLEEIVNSLEISREELKLALLDLGLT